MTRINTIVSMTTSEHLLTKFTITNFDVVNRTR